MQLHEALVFFQSFESRDEMIGQLASTSTVENRNHISHEQFGAKYGADAADIDFAVEYGLNVTEASIPKRLVILSGPVNISEN